VTRRAPDACLGRLEDTLPEEGEAGPPITLALHELEAMDMACRDPVAPLQGVPGLDGGQIVLQPTGETAQLRDAPVGRLGHPCFQIVAPPLGPLIETDLV
jgi:hypothetical protein